ncbi:hypothetical protein B0T20DRAFT_492177 [Sordaria brevicollis]|uniref:Uncharacterized protein n=1 Tax=Sordaria brevicollis TaxID=83679 RepID=A0AAE0PK41_SORBR|nr:hypothetical protein B0T20DRAFT_492177 [Sordaria brevicollis]
MLRVSLTLGYSASSENTHTRLPAVCLVPRTRNLTADRKRLTDLGHMGDSLATRMSGGNVNAVMDPVLKGLRGCHGRYAGRNQIWRFLLWCGVFYARLHHLQTPAIFLGDGLLVAPPQLSWCESLPTSPKAPARFGTVEKHPYLPCLVRRYTGAGRTTTTLYTCTAATTCGSFARIVFRATTKRVTVLHSAKIRLFLDSWNRLNSRTWPPAVF